MFGRLNTRHHAKRSEPECELFLYTVAPLDCVLQHDDTPNPRYHLMSFGVDTTSSLHICTTSTDAACVWTREIFSLLLRLHPSTSPPHLYEYGKGFATGRAETREKKQDMGGLSGPCLP
nr:hypothetical protein CFP56_00613 [Quercus suber]